MKTYIFLNAVKITWYSYTSFIIIHDNLKLLKSHLNRSLYSILIKPSSLQNIFTHFF